MKAPALAVVLHPGHADGEHDGGEHEDGEQAKLDAADALIEAVHGKDPHAVLEAFGALHDLHCDDGDEEEAEGPEAA